MVDGLLNECIRRYFFPSWAKEAKKQEKNNNAWSQVTTAQVVETSVTVNNNSPIQDYVHPDDQTQPTFEMTPGFKPFTEKYVNKIEENEQRN